MRRLAILWIFTTIVFVANADENSKKESPSRSKLNRQSRDSDSWEWESDFNEKRSKSAKRGWDSDSWESDDDSRDRSNRVRPEVNGNRISRGGDSDWSSDDWDSDYRDNLITEKQEINAIGNSRKFYDSFESDSDSIGDRKMPRTRPSDKNNRIDSSDDYYNSIETDSDSSDRMEARNRQPPSRNRGFSSERDSDYSGSVNRPGQKVNQRVYESDVSSDWFSDESDFNGRSVNGNGKETENLPNRKQYRDSDSSDWFSSERESSKRGSNIKLGGRQGRERDSDSDDWFNDENTLFENGSYEKLPRSEMRSGRWLDDMDDDDSDRRSSRIIRRLGRRKQPFKSVASSNRLDDSDERNALPSGVAFLGKDDN